MTRAYFDAQEPERRAKSTGKKGLKKAAEYLLEEANRTAPHDEGTMERTAGTDADEARATVYYTTPYARRQHEELDFRHAPGRRAKWLEKTVSEKRSKILSILGKRVKIG